MVPWRDRCKKLPALPVCRKLPSSVPEVWKGLEVDQILVGPPFKVHLSGSSDQAEAIRAHTHTHTHAHTHTHIHVCMFDYYCVTNNTPIWVISSTKD
jgi:hypothetical protein